MDYGLKRKDYEELLLLGHGEVHQGMRLEDASPEEQRRWVDAEYPKSTQAAVVELRGRGLDASAPTLEYLIRKGEIPTPKGEGRSRKWSRRDIDRAAAFMEAEQMFTPGTVARMVYNIDPAQDIRARNEAFAKNPHLPQYISHFVMEIKPGEKRLGIYATVSYRPMSRNEDAVWKQRIEADN